MAKLQWPRMPNVEVPLFGGRVCMTTSRAEYEAAARYLGDCDDDLLHAIHNALGLTACFRNRDGDALHIVGVFDGMPRTLVHELAHVTFDVLDRVGEDTGRGPRETFCYLQDFLFEEFEEPLADSMLGQVAEEGKKPSKTPSATPKALAFSCASRRETAR